MNARTWHSRALLDRDAGLVFSFQGLTRLVPLLVCGGFVVATVVLLMVGPLDWHLSAQLEVYLFLTAALVSLTGGYLWSVLRRDNDSDKPRRTPISASTLVVVGATIYLALYLPTVHTTTGSWFPNVWEGLTDTGSAYANNKYANENGSQLVLYVRMLVAPFTIVLLPVTLYFWSRLSTLARLLGVLCTLLAVGLTIAQGINRGVAELCATIILFLTLLVAATLSRRDYVTALKAVVGIVLVSALFAGYYSLTITNRISADAERSGGGREPRSQKARDEQLMNAAQLSTATQRKDSPYFDVVPGPIEPVGVVFTSYVTHGYKGLDLAMQEPFQPTWGLGFSQFVRHNVLRVVGESSREGDVEDRTYAGQIQDRWPVGLVWGTFFIHPASDISFPGTVALIALIGFLFGLSWRDTLTRRDPLACAVFFYLCILVIYLPANNQLFQGGELAIGFTVIVAAWLWGRRRAPRSPNAQRS